jgi:tRNA dimethylallyltransferase
MVRCSRQAAVLIAGPTASGKSALALGLAQRLGGVIINADSMQLYTDLRLLSARPTEAEEAQAPHRLYGVRDGADPCSAAQWRDLARLALEEAWQNGQLPILVGGTSLYLEALLHGLAEVPPIDPAVRAVVRAMETAEIRAALLASDAIMAERLNPADRQRQARALEVWRSTGKSLAYWQGVPTGGLANQPGLGPLACLRLLPDRAQVYAACDARLETMFAAGAIEEVAHLMTRRLPPSAPILKALGVPEISAYLTGTISNSDALAKAQQATRNYVKRQLTWARNRLNAWEAIATQEKNARIEESLIILRKKGLTTQS